MKNMHTQQNRIINGDFYDELLKIQMKSVDMILTDLPYNTTQVKWDKEIDLRKMWDLFHHVLKDNGVVCLTASDIFAHKLALSNEKEYKYDLIWHKSKSGSALTGKYRPVKYHEVILVFGNKIKYNPQMVKGEPYKRNQSPSNKTNNHKVGIRQVTVNNLGTRFPSTIQYFQQKWRRQDQLHPTQKPVELFEWLIKSFSDEGDVVLDCCAGSGTTGVACNNLNRNYILIEKEEEYYNIIKGRIQESDLK